MKHQLYKTVFSLLVLFISTAVFAQFEILFVGKSDNLIDAALSEYFGLEGYNVTFVEEADFKVEGGVYASAAGYEGFDVLFVSESIGSSSANNYKNAGFPIPSVVTEGYVVKTSRWGILADESETYFLQASSATLTADVLTMLLINDDHWITQDYGLDYNLVWADASDPTKLGVTAFNLNDDIEGAIPLGQFLFDMGGLPSIWAIPKGSILHSTTELPNMVIIGVIQTDVGQVFTGDFQQFLVKCVRWATDDYEAQGARLPRETNVVVGPNPTTGIVHVSLNLPEAGNVRINIYDIAGKLMKSKNSDHLSAGTTTIQLDLSGMSQAQYIYEIITRNDILKGKIMKE
jgi:hypothetical protein